MPIYNVYTALLTQSGTNDPVVTALENTLGGVPVWTRIGLGFYRATLAGAFAAPLYISGFSNWQGTGTTFLPISDENTVIGYYSIYKANDNEIELIFTDDLFQPTDYSTLYGSATDFSVPEIRKYP